MERTFGTTLAALMWSFLLLVFFGESFLLLYASLSLFGGQALLYGLWYVFAFVSGSLMVVIPSMLPVTHHAVVSVMKHGLAKGVSGILAFGVGITLILLWYGILFGAAGSFVKAALLVHPVALSGAVYLFIGVFAYLLALGELGFLHVRTGAYHGDLPAFMRRGGEVRKHFLFGLFAGNIGAMSGSPAVPVLIAIAALSGDPVFGAFLFLAHALGRILPTVLLTYLSALKINGAHELSMRKHELERFAGAFMIVASSILMTSGFYALFGPFFAQSGTSVYGVDAHVFLFGTFTALVLMLFPLWWNYVRESLRISGRPEYELWRNARTSERLEEERRSFERTMHLHEGRTGEKVRHIERDLDRLSKERRILEESIRYGGKGLLRAEESERYEKEAHRLRGYWYLTLTVLAFALTLFFIHA